MFKKLIFYISFSFLVIYNYSEIHAEVKNIIPLKKPLLDKITLENKLTQGILKPKPKPVEIVKNKVLSKKITSVIPVTMVHGGKDELVPVSFSKKILPVFTKANKKLIIIKNGDHSLSNKNSLKKIIKELNDIVVDVV